MTPLARLRHFLASGPGAGSLLFACAVVAVIVANSPLAASYQRLLATEVTLVAIEGAGLTETVGRWINDALMAIFFLLVSLEIKRELVTGELSSFSRAILPTIAAVGGMVVPALIFLAFNFGDAIALRGWAVPTATDIAFSLGVLALLGTRVPPTLKVLLTAIAVIDDLGAIAIIALFYTSDLKPPLIAASFGVFVVMLALNLLAKVRSPLPYLLLGILMWDLMHASGVHATIAGVMTAFAIPHARAGSTETSTLVRLEHALHGPVTYLILPLFVLANAGVALAGISPAALVTVPLASGIAAGLLIGKPIGICGSIWLALKLGIVELPRSVNWTMLFGLALLCGIGFTVSLFIGNLGFAKDHADLLNLVKIGVLSGSIAAGVIGYITLRHFLPHDSGA